MKLQLIPKSTVLFSSSKSLEEIINSLDRLILWERNVDTYSKLRLDSFKDIEGYYEGSIFCIKRCLRSYRYSGILIVYGEMFETKDGITVKVEISHQRYVRHGLRLFYGFEALMLLICVLSGYFLHAVFVVNFLIFLITLIVVNISFYYEKEKVEFFLREIMH